MRLLNSASGEVLGLAFAPHSEALAAAVKDQGVFLWNFASDTPIRLDTFADKRARNLFFSPDGRVVHWLGRHGWRAHDRDTRRTTSQQLDAAGRLLLLVQTPDGSRLVSEHSFPDSSLIGWRHGDDGWEKEWDVSTATVAMHRLAVCPTGRLVAALARTPQACKPGEDPFRLELRSLIHGAVKGSARYPHAYECPLVFSPDGGLLIGVHDMTLLVWPVPELGEPLPIRNATRQHFTAVAFHPSGRHLFATSNDTTVHAYDTATWARTTRYTWDLGRLRSVAVSCDGTLAAAGGDHGEVVVWDVDL